MKSFIFQGLVFWVICSFQVAVASSVEPVTAIVGAKVFDGTGNKPEVKTIVISGNIVVSMGNNIDVPSGATVIDARGEALLPGLYDLHSHWISSGNSSTIPQIAAAYVTHGVTFVNDFNEPPEAYEPLRKWLNTLVAPHVSFAARISTPGGHGADWGDQSTTKWVNNTESAKAAIAAIMPYKPDLIKAFTDGWRYGTSPDNTSMDGTTLAAVVASAHAHHLKVLTHTVTVDRGLIAAEAGVDSLAHIMQDRELKSEEVQKIKCTGMSVIPTLSVYDPYEDKSGHTFDVTSLSRIKKFERALYNVKLLYEAGVRIGVGTDAGMPSTPHGQSTLHELELLVKAGLTPQQALIAATADSASIMGDPFGNGTLHVGAQADIVLVKGEPWSNIHDIWHVDKVWVSGKIVVQNGAVISTNADLRRFENSAKIRPFIDNFERSDHRSSLGTLLMEATDNGLGRSTEIAQIVPRDKKGHALLVTGRMGYVKNPHVGVIIPLVRGSILSADISSYRGFQVDTEGAISCKLKVRLIGVENVWEHDLDSSISWLSSKISFKEFHGERVKNDTNLSQNLTKIKQIEVMTECPAGRSVEFELDDVKLY